MVSFENYLCSFFCPPLFYFILYLIFCLARLFATIFDCKLIHHRLLELIVIDPKSDII